MILEKRQRLATWLVFLVVVFNVYAYLHPDAFRSPLMLASFQHHYPLDHWHTPSVAVGLFDDDNQDDVIEHTGCVFLTRTSNRIIDDVHQCEMTSQPLMGRQVFSGSWHSYMTLLQGENWIIYENRMGIPRLYEILPDATIVRKPAQLVHWVQAMGYMVTHLFTLLI